MNECYDDTNDSWMNSSDDFENEKIEDYMTDEEIIEMQDRHDRNEYMDTSFSDYKNAVWG